MRALFRSRLLLSAAAFVIGWGIPSKAFPFSLSATPSLSISETWDSNIRNVETNEQSDFVTRIAPRLTLNVGMFHSTLNLSGGFESEIYAQETDLNETTATTDYGISVTEPLQIGEKWTLVPYARYTKSNDTVRYRLSNPSPGGGGVSLAGTSRRSKVQGIMGSLEAAYRYSGTGTARLRAGGARRDVKEGGPELVDDQTVFASASLESQWTERFTGGIFLEGTRNSYESFPSDKIGTAQLIGNYSFTPYFRIEARAGASYLVNNSPEGGGREDKDWTPSGGITGTYVRGTFTGSLNLSYMYQPGTYGTTTTEGRCGLTLAHQLTESWSWTFEALVAQSQSIGDDDSLDQIAFGSSAGIRYQATRNISVGLIGSMLRQNSRSVVGYDYTKHAVTLLVDWSTVATLF